MRTVFILTAAFCGPLGISSGQDVVGEAITRMSAVFSGRYTYSSVTVGQKLTRPPAREFVFSGSSWKLMSRVVADDFFVKDPAALKRAGLNPSNPPTLPGEREDVILCHRGKIIRYGNSPQVSGEIVYGASIDAGEIEVGAGKREARPPMLGTCWYKSIRDFVTKHKQKAVRKGSDTIAGITVEVYEWPVPANDLSVYVVGVDNRSYMGGAIRLYIAPSLGYMCPRIELLGKADEVCNTLQASEFYQVNGFWVPRSSKLSTVSEEGKPGYWVEWSNIQASQLNESIPEEIFTIQFRPGTEVNDHRDGKTTKFFKVHDGLSVPDDLSDVLVPEGTYHRPWYRTVWGGVGIGLGVGFLVLAGLFAARILRARGKPA